MATDEWRPSPEVSPHENWVEAFHDLDADVAYPAVRDCPCDIRVESTDHRFLRVAVEPGWISAGRIRLKPDSCDGIDYFLIVCRELDTCYLVGADEFDVSISLRVDPPKRDPGTIHCAEEYELAARWPLERERELSTTGEDSITANSAGEPPSSTQT